MRRPSAPEGRAVRGGRLATLAALALGSLLALALGELSARALGWKAATGPSPITYDPLLGWAPRPGFQSPAGASWPIHVGPDGLRSNGRTRSLGRPILAVGDSYTFGDGVVDDETWPASLERQLGVPVLNGGASAYGFDQTVLRAERLLEQRPVRGLVVSLIRDDARRCQLSAFCGWRKPFFEVEAGRPVLRNVPVPRGLLSRLPVGSLLPYSALLHWIGQASLPRDRAEHRDGLAVVHLLIERLGALARRGPPILLLIQGPMGGGPRGPRRFEASTLPVVREFGERARASGLATLDLVSAGWAEVSQRPALRNEWFLQDPGGHMSAAGNAWVASQLGARLRQLGWLEAERQ